MNEPLNVLLIDDDPDDHVLTRDLLAESMGSNVRLEWASSYEAGVAALSKKVHDVCLLDFRLGVRTGLDLLREPSAIASDVPIILLTGQGQREIDMEAMQAGAADYLTKDSLFAATLERTIRHSLERHRDRKALRQLNEALESRVDERTRELEKANAALREADQRKNEFLATLAHELRNPLAPIANALELLKLADDDVELCRQSRDTMERQVAQMIRLIEDLLDVSRITRGKITLRKSSVDLLPIVHQAVEAAQPLCHHKSQTLKMTLSRDPLIIHADPARIAQIVGNLLNNAFKFTPEGGQIELTVGREGNQAMIRVRDNGIGLAADQLPRIFEMFTQVDSPMERSDSGLGIGLTLVKSLVELHGGTVDVKSPGLGQGSEFTVTLPLESSASQAKSTAPRTAHIPSAAKKRKILVVDDNRDSAVSLAMLLKLAGHQTSTAFTGAAALQAAEQDPPEVILLDIGLPDLSGYEVAKQIRTRPWGQSVTLVALTGWGQVEDRERSKLAGFDQHLIKPVEHAALMKLLD